MVTTTSDAGNVKNVLEEEQDSGWQSTQSGLLMPNTTERESS
jgi:hypothetical protein